MRKYQKGLDGEWKSVMLSPIQHRKCKRLADAEGITISAILARGLLRALDDPGEAVAKSERPNNPIQTSVYVPDASRLRAGKFLLAGATWQHLFSRGLELLLEEVKAA